MLEFLKPISGEHSVSRVVAVVHVPQIFLKPQNIFDKINESSNLSKYQKKGMMKVKRIDVTNQNVGISKDEHEIGFILEEFENSGKLENIFKLENINDRQSNILLENRIYSDWDLFLSRFITDINEVAKISEIFIEAISLIYVDEFIWESETDIDVTSIFNTESELINKKFINSPNGTFISITQEKIEENGDLEEKVEVAFSNRIKRISIGHQCAIKFSKIEVYSQEANDVLKKQFNLAHERNKTVLKDVLSQEVLKLIKVK